jgi:hypothetical protein
MEINFMLYFYYDKLLVKFEQCTINLSLRNSEISLRCFA